MESTILLPLKNRLKSAQAALDGFPWLLATVLYTLSWGWSLLRPNTLYWDDWVFQQDWNSVGLDFSSELWSRRQQMGGAPWAGFIEMLLPISGSKLFTFGFFLGAGVLTHQILKIGLDFISPITKRLIVLLFLLIPVNHARISMIVFDYTETHFFFYLGWFVLVRFNSVISFGLACAILFWSFKTHSFLFFSALPLLHFGWNHRASLKDLKNLNSAHIRISAITSLPAIYIVARALFWPRIENSTYHNVYSHGVLMSATLFIPFTCSLFITYLWFRSRRRVPNELKIILVGTFALAVSLFPYLISNNINRYIFSFNIGWQSRHLMLTPLGISFVVVGISQLISKKKHYIAKLALTLSVLVNIFVGSQYYLQSVQQAEISNLFKTQNIPDVVAEFGDETARFKGRGATYSEYEFFGMLNESGYSYPKRVGYKYVCKANPAGIKLTVKSDKSFFNALLSRDTGTYFEITTCAEVLLQQG